MNLRQAGMCGAVCLVTMLTVASAAHSQTGAETFTATAAVKTAGAATANAPVTIVVSRKMSQAEADSLTGAFKTGGVTALRKALVGVKPTGTVQLGNGKPTPTRLTLERPTDKGRLLTIVTDEPILFLGAGVPGAKPKEGYDFAIIDIVVDAAGNGSGTLSPADDYAVELVRLTDVKKVK
jgi:hypothetical protein